MAEDSTRQGNLEAGMLKPSPNHGTQRLPNDDDDDDNDDDGVPDIVLYVSLPLCSVHYILHHQLHALRISIARVFPPGFPLSSPSLS